MRKFGACERHHMAKEAVEEETWSRWCANFQYNDLPALSRLLGTSLFVQHLIKSPHPPDDFFGIIHVNPFFEVPAIRPGWFCFLGGWFCLSGRMGCRGRRSMRRCKRYRLAARGPVGGRIRCMWVPLRRRRPRLQKTPAL